MKKEDFKKRLKEAKLTKLSFSKLLNLKYQSVNVWGNNNRTVPYWVESWLDLYIENLKYQNMKDILKNSKICNEVVTK